MPKALNQLRAALLSMLLLSIATIAFPQSHEKSQTMRVNGRHLYTAAGERVVLRGVNEMFVWSDDPTGEIIYPEIEQTGANVVRIVWTIEGDVQELDRNIENCLAHGMIPMVELHDSTGHFRQFEAIVSHWKSDAMLELIAKYEKWLLLNIANEAGDYGVTAEEFSAIYLPAIGELRAVGIRVPLIVDASDWGKDEKVILATWKQLRAADPLQNTMFSVHTYWVKEQETRLRSLIETVANEEIPFLWGEGPQQVGFDCESLFPWELFLKLCQENDIGWIAWSWGYHPNGDCFPGKFDMTQHGVFGQWRNAWGEGVAVSDTHSIKNTSVRPASLLRERHASR